MVDDCLNQNKDIGFDQQILIFKNVCARSRMPFMFMQCFCNVCRFWERSRNRLQEKDLQKNIFPGSHSLSLLHHNYVELNLKKV